MAPVPSGRLKGNPGTTVPPQLVHLLAAGLDVRHLDIDHAVERADLALRNAKRPDSGATRDDLGRLIGALHRGELPVEELAVEFLRLREVGRGDVEPGDAPRSDVRGGSLVGRCTELPGSRGSGPRPSPGSRSASLVS